MYIKNSQLFDAAKCSTANLGTWGEACAKSYLIKANYKILATNWRIRGGELDLIAFDPQRNAIVAIEVKTRRYINAGMPEEAITPTKLRRLRALLLSWLNAQNQWYENLAIDVIGISVSGQGYYLNHTKDLVV